ncbi:MAG: maltodextrin glucosidase [Chloroflexi bacterium]|nr:maltodextrin glucosidase [Chloroflexota bacterium]
MNKQWTSTIHHDGSTNYVSETYPRLGDTIQLSLRIGVEASVQAVYLRTFPDGEQALTPMHHAATDDVSHWWQCKLLIDAPTVHYRFIVVADDGVWFYAAAGVTANVPLDHNDFRIVADYDAPAWVQTAVFYQIFPDRFANHNPDTNPQPHEYDFRGIGPKTYAWEQPPDKEQPFPIIFYGGDLPGITQKLDYLQTLGVNALYLNPIFTAYSNHKYDVADYENVDSHFGGNNALIELRHALDRRKMRYILDIVPNHCGYWHPWFQTAQDNLAAPEAEFFTFYNHPDEYASWLNVWTLPKLNYHSADLRHRMFAGENSVIRRWLHPPFAADGWRIDVANMLGRQGKTQINTQLSQEMRHAVKETRADAYYMAENFFDASSQLQGDQYDGAMNYSGFTYPLAYWLIGYKASAHGLDGAIESPVPWSTQATATMWQNHLAAIPWQIALQQFNLLGSHDVPRIRTTLAKNDALLRLAVMVQFTFPGVPCIYYGDEIGMTDDEMLRQRACMIWDEERWDHDLLTFFKKLIKLRRESAILQTGGFQLLAVEEDTLAFQREGGNGRILTIAHRSQTPRPASPLPVRHGGIIDGTRFTDFFTNQEFVVENGGLNLPNLFQGCMLLIEVS